MRHTQHTKRLSMASVDNSIGGAAGDASSGQEPIDVEPGSSPSPMDNEVRHFVFLLSWVQQEHSVNPYCCAERALKDQTDKLYFCTSLAPPDVILSDSLALLLVQQPFPPRLGDAQRSRCIQIFL